ncbi:ATP-dependent RNA helicase DEAH13 isoform X2 [Rosa chinensis]|uniref:ATP-dependent RNA helicase DEAH13 isoform X2 n=1 Tax=Rosa chinensis TaxID=74649 RepID=UPI000D08DD67|nr:ATP-dependent RNA helicase DEAH13 isoform X2 [Rosa chinensis]
MENFEQPMDLSSGGGDSNAIVLPNKRKRKRKGATQEGKILGTRKTPKMTKSQERKLQKLEEEKEKALLLSKSIDALGKYKLPEGAYSLLQSSKDIGQVESKKEKRRKAVLFSKAGLEVPYTNQPLKKKDGMDACSESEPESERTQPRQDLDKSGQVQPMVIQKEIQKTTSVFLNSSQGLVYSRGHATNGGPADGSLSKNVICNVSLPENIASSVNDDHERTEDRVKGSPKVTSSRTGEFSDFAAPRSLIAPTIVHVSRPIEVENTRKDLPIVMMEQEIMEAVNDHSTVIICGETGCGKTTQVPQFLFEAGFGSSHSCHRSGIIGVTQPRRVAVLATAKRVAYELGLHLGKEVGFQVRFDKKFGDSSSIKFMTDGILLRELQSDFLLKRYSIIILDEAHERSLSTDILIGMLSRVISTRQEIYVKQQRAVLSGKTIDPGQQVFPLKLVLMSATLQVEDFISGRKLFRDVPPVIEVPTRQFPVTTHFSKRTGTDYVGQAYKKVLAIHKRLPRGGILVFVTGQKEVEFLCQKLRRASTELVMKTSGGKIGCNATDASNKDVELLDMNEINEAFEVEENLADHQIDRFSSVDEVLGNIYEDELDASYDSDTDSEVEIIDDDGGLLLHNPPEIDGVGADVLGETGSIASLKAAFEALAGKTELYSSSDGKQPISVTVDAYFNKSHPSLGKKSEVDIDNSPGGLHVLPLYAMLPAASQLRVFEEVKEGDRLVVVATNVAETSLTIPGVKYVVDTGRVKVKDYNSSNGMETYNIKWISKASAAQRKGRAGRTGPGHCYRLYSSAVYNNEFPDFSPAEILKVPIDGVVLLMKSMNIEKVSNFPFPTPPDVAALGEAERCLNALEALDSNGRLTPLGKAMARYPMSPRHSRMLLTVIQIMYNEKSYSRSKLILAYAVAAAAALSLSNPFVRQFENDSNNHDLDQDENLSASVNNKVLEKQEKLRRKKLKETVKVFREKFSNPVSDALSVAYALQCYELSRSPLKFCNDNALHPKTMEEMSKLRKQLLQLVFSQCGVSGSEKDFSCIFGSLEDVEHVWRASHDKSPLSLYEEDLLGQAICAGWADRVAKRIRGTSGSSEVDRKVHAVRYQACMVEETVFLHRWSSVSNAAPEFLVYTELIQTRRPYMHGVTSVKPEWLVKYAPSLCTFSAASSDAKQYYEPVTDQVLHDVIPAFGPHLWKLPPHSLPITNYISRVAVFAYALLEGQVLPCLRRAREFMKAPPASILRPEAEGQRRAGNLLAKLNIKKIDSCAMLREIWKENPNELHSEIQDWFKESFRKNLAALWSDMLREVLLEPQERFSKREIRRIEVKR